MVPFRVFAASAFAVESLSAYDGAYTALARAHLVRDDWQRRATRLTTMKKTTRTMSKIDDARACFAQGYSCSQSVAATFAADFGVDQATMLRIAGPFGGGVARTGGACGALGGALMILGLKYASAQPDPTAKERTYQIAREFVEEFRARNGATDCRDLLGRDIGTPEGRQAIRESGVSKAVCPRLVESAVEMLEELLREAA